MDSIDYRNRQVEKEERESTEYVIVKKSKSPEMSVTLVAVKLTKEQCEEIRVKKELIPRVVETLKEANIITFSDDVKEVYFLGELSKFTQHEKVVTMYPQRRLDIREGKDAHYRDYTRTRKSQELNMHLVNICRDSKTSWKSVSKKLRSDYGILVKVKINLLKKI